MQISSQVYDVMNFEKSIEVFLDGSRQEFTRFAYDSETMRVVATVAVAPGPARALTVRMTTVGNVHATFTYNKTSSRLVETGRTLFFDGFMDPKINKTTKFMLGDLDDAGLEGDALAAALDQDPRLLIELRRWKPKTKKIYFDCVAGAGGEDWVDGPGFADTDALVSDGPITRSKKIVGFGTGEVNTSSYKKVEGRAEEMLLTICISFEPGAKRPVTVY